MSLLRSRVDLGAIARNSQVWVRRAGQARLVAVVKADAYGHGVRGVVSTMEANGVGAFGVATLEEAIELSPQVSVPVLAWLWNPGPALEEALALGVEIGVPSLQHARALVIAEIPARCFVMVETGLHRNGMEESEWREAFELLAGAEHITVTGVSSHFSNADTPDSPANAAQRQVFARAVELGRSLGLDLPLNHLANSPGTASQPEAHWEQVRVGLGFYGFAGLEGEVDSELTPAMTWAADVVTVKPIRAGESVSYGQTWTAQADGWLALIPAGYADGVPRAMQSKLEVGISGQRYPQVGRVCMDQLVVDLGENPYGVKPGDEAVLFGRGGMSVSEWAQALDTIEYEVLCLPKGRTTQTYEE